MCEEGWVTIYLPYVYSFTLNVKTVSILTYLHTYLPQYLPCCCSNVQMDCGYTIGQKLSFGIKVTLVNLGLCVSFCGAIAVPHKPCVFDEMRIRRAENVEKLLFQQSIPLRLSTLARFTFLIDAVPTMVDLGVEASHTSTSVLGFKFSWCTLISLAESDFSYTEIGHCDVIFIREPLPFFFAPYLSSIPGLTHSSIVS